MQGSGEYTAYQLAWHNPNWDQLLLSTSTSEVLVFVQLHVQTYQILQKQSSWQDYCMQLKQENTEYSHRLSGLRETA